ncbi:MAG: peptidase S8 [Clostridiales bacterium]|nr:peptidase S8 [Clostridiales bacterium]
MFNSKNIRSGIFTILVSAVMLMLGCTNVYANAYRKGEIIVKYKKNKQQPQNRAFFVNGTKLTMSCIDDDHSYYYVKEDNMDQVLEKCKENPDIEYAQPNYVYSIRYTTSDPFLTYEWGLDQINAHKVWDLNGTDNPPMIAVVDTGVNVQHLDLKSNIVKGYNIVDGTTDVRDDCGHGTHIAGIAAAVTNNSTGIAGVSGNSKILPVKVLDQEGNGYSSDIAAGIKWAADNGAKIINLSLGGSNYDNYLKEAVEYAIKKGCIVVAAAGNEGTYRPTYPAAFEGVIAVAAVDSKNQICNFSNFGRYIDIAAPGLDIYSTSKDGGYEYKSGTSMACAFVSGAIALVWGGSPDKTAAEIEEIIKESANKVDISPTIDYDIGSGVLDAYGAYKMAKDESGSETKYCTVTDVERIVEEIVEKKLNERLGNIITTNPTNNTGNTSNPFNPFNPFNPTRPTRPSR